MAQNAQRLMVAPGEGKSVWLGGLGVVFKISGEETGGSFALVEHPIEPRRLVPPHVHTREDEYSYVLEGEIGVRLGDQEFTAGPGTYVFKPRGIPHTFWNAGKTPARIIEIIAPAGFEKYFEELPALFAEGGPPDHKRHTELRARYGEHPVDNWAAELMAKYNLKLLGQ